MDTDCFIFESYHFDPSSGEIRLRYSLGEVDFEEVLELPQAQRREIPEELLERALFNLHLIAGISYWKTSCASRIEVRSGVLSEAEAEFWNKLYTKGLGEFFYQNQIKNFEELVEFPFDEDVKGRSWTVELPERSLVPLGGGKDSIVAVELLRGQDMEFEVFNMGDHQVVRHVAAVMRKWPLVVKRELSPELFRMNAEGALNGHVPLSAYLAFLTVLVGLLYGFKYIVLGNERSANEGNVQFEGLEVNHQYSKSFEFEQDVRAYLREFLTPNVHYFSVLRPYYEIQIAKIFSAHPEYFPIFTSCNRNFKVREDGAERLWCGTCPKCAFVFTILAPFIPKGILLHLFEKNLWDDEKLWPLFRELLGLEEVKPFDCVGTPEEVQEAFRRAGKYYGNDAIVKRFREEFPEVEARPELFEFGDEHLYPRAFHPLAEHLCKRVLVLGFGKEGQSVHRFFRTYYPEWTLGVADRQEALKAPDDDTKMHVGADYLEALWNYDVIVKSPGIPWGPELEEHVKRITSATQLFFDNVHPSNFVVGVTGSKGKSTTASLIYEVLKAAGRKTLLVGNIGLPALEEFDAQDTVFVMELSSYQLDQVGIRPNIAVWTSFFPDHLDYHGNLEFYLEAKSNITRNQTEADYLVYHADCEDVHRLDTRAERVIVKDFEPVESGLRGAHNQANLALVREVAKILEVDDQVFVETARKFKGLPHRLEKVGTFKGITFVDDANATTPEGTLAAIRAYSGQIGTIFLGGTDRGYKFEELVEALAAESIPNVVLFPDTGARIAELLPPDYEPLIFETDSMEAAVEFAYAHTEEGKVCLLSMASPSYSLFKNFEEKGKLFQKWVKLNA